LLRRNSSTSFSVLTLAIASGDEGRLLKTGCRRASHKRRKRASFLTASGYHRPARLVKHVLVKNGSFRTKIARVSLFYSDSSECAKKHYREAWQPLGVYALLK
jgi:hypothetical protein